MFTIVHAITRWRPYLIGRRFQIKTDHKSLKYFLEQKISSPEQQKWVTKLLGFDYEIIYKKGKENVVADALSRLPEQAKVSAISLPTTSLLEDIREEWKKDPEISNIIKKLEEDPSAIAHYTWDSRDLRYKGRIVLIPDSPCIVIILHEMHSIPSAGHSRFLRTYKRVKQIFYWRGMKKIIAEYMAQCDVCQ